MAGIGGVSSAALRIRPFASLEEAMHKTLSVANALKARHNLFAKFYPYGELASEWGIRSTLIWDLEPQVFTEWISQSGKGGFPNYRIKAGDSDSDFGPEINFYIEPPGVDLEFSVPGINSCVLSRIPKPLKQEPFLTWLVEEMIVQLSPEHVDIQSQEAISPYRATYWLLWLKDGQPWPDAKVSYFDRAKDTQSQEREFLGGKLYFWPEY